MRLYFFRHGEAEPATGEMTDFQRPLTPRGEQRTRRAAAALAARKVRPAHLYSSPLVRARQTAEILGKALGLKVEVREEIEPGFRINALQRLVDAVGDDEDLMFVGHNPDFPTVIGELIGGGDVVMKKGGLARVDVVLRDPLHGRLVWLLPPKLLDALE
ncbi:MAG: phosphohistidine phosphatase SixA [Chloroflexota bacterium]|nr:MAG: phosphohistidine phosphatase SixA [Chloroflexota bacterium]